MDSARRLLCFLAPLAVLMLVACDLGRLRPPGPVTGAGDQSAPVPILWTVAGSQPGAERLLLQGGTLHAIPSEVRLVTANGQSVAGGPATWRGDTGPGLCGREEGVARADLVLPPGRAADFTRDWPPGYRVEALVGGTWRPAQLTFAGCRPTA